MGLYTESTKNTADLNRVYSEKNGVYTKSTQSNTDVHFWTYYTTYSGVPLKLDKCCFMY